MKLETRCGRSPGEKKEQFMSYQKSVASSQSSVASEATDYGLRTTDRGLRLLKHFLLPAMLAAGVQAAHGFALLGPLEPYQAPVIGYNLAYLNSGSPGSPVALGDIGGPHNLGEEYRRNTPVLYYSFDATFWDFFGSNGVAAVDQAMAIMNSLTNVSQYTPNLLEFPLQAQRINYEAQNLALTDLKSIALHLMVEQMGLAQPERYTWTLHDRQVITPPPCPGLVTYLVISRNFDIVPSAPSQFQNSRYVNGTLYTYGIIEFCTGPPPLGLTVPYAVDPLAETETSVAADAFTYFTGLTAVNVGGVGLHIGGYYTYLTRDDVGGLRYLLQTNNYNLERSGPNTVQYVTNNLAQFLITQDLGLLLAQAPTNSAAQLQALYPGLIVNDVSNWFGLSVTTNTTLVVVPAPLAPPGFVQVKTVTTFTTNIVQFFQHTFGNIITNFFFNKTVYQVQTVSPGGNAFAPAGSPPALQTSTKTFTINAPSGDFYILPPGLCAIKVLNNDLLSTTVATTNLISTVTNTTGAASNNFSTVSTISYFTNRAVVYLPVTCDANTVSTRQGIEQVHFVRRDFDSLIGTFWAPATNNYFLVELTNNTIRSQEIQRVATAPDFLFTTDDLAVGPSGNNFVGTVFRTQLIYNQTANNANAGPGTIESPSVLTFDKVGPFFRNQTALTLSAAGFISDQSTAIAGLAWASFDGSTNAPVVYPNGTSIANYINQIVIQIQPQSLPNGTNGFAYSFVYTNTVSGVVYTNTLSVTGGQGPYTWSLTPGSPSLPAGLNLSSGGQITGTPSPVLFSTTFDFTIRVTDATSRFVDAPLSITIVP
jgi:hypothetical protein